MMSGTLAELMPLALAVAISPLPIIAVLLTLATPRGRANGPTMVAGWMSMLGAIGALTALAARDVAPRAGGETAVAGTLLSLGFGLVLLLAAQRQWRGRPRHGEEATLPAWMAALDRLSPLSAAVAGALAVLNPKNVVPAVVGAAAVARNGAPTLQQLAAYAGFIAVASAGIATPVVLCFALGHRSRRILDRLRHLLARHNARILAAVFLAMGAAFVSDAVVALAGWPP